MLRALTARCRRIARRRLADEDGSLIVEVMVTAALLVTVSLGVLMAFDASTAQSGTQKAQAIAVDVAQSELDELRQEDFETLRALSGTPKSVPVKTSTGGDLAFSVTSRAEQVVDPNGPVGCATPRDRDLVKVTTTVTWPNMGNRRPVVVDTLVAAPVGQSGGLIVRIADRDGNGVAGISITASGPISASAVTDATGCARWDRLTAGAYDVAFATAGYVTPEGETAVTKRVDVSAEQVQTHSFVYDRAGTVPLRFFSELDEDDFPDALEDEIEWYEDRGEIDTDPARVSFEHTGLNAPRVFDTAPSIGGLFPFRSPYAVYADGCSAAKPTSPPAPSDALRAVLVNPGVSTARQDVRLPALVARVRNSAGPVPASTTVHVTTACGTKLPGRRLNQDRNVVDPGFPFGQQLTVCVQTPWMGGRFISTRADNLNYRGTVMPAIDLAGSTPGACP